MARIRTIKPEFCQSESMGRVSRDAQLLFVKIWTIADDAGRTRGSSRMLASLLYPYDDDAPKLIERWLMDLGEEGCIRRYEVAGSTYLDIPNWLKHQKIDKPSQSRLPAFEEGSPLFAKPREGSATDLGPRTVDQGPSTAIKDPGNSAEADAGVPSKSTSIFDHGRRYLESSGVPERQARSILGKWRRDFGEDAVLAAINRSEREAISDPIAFISKFLSQAAAHHNVGRVSGAISAMRAIEST